MIKLRKQSVATEIKFLSCQGRFPFISDNVAILEPDTDSNFIINLTICFEQV